MLNLGITKISFFLAINIWIVFNIFQNRILRLDILFSFTFFFEKFFIIFFVNIVLTQEPHDPAIYYITLKSPFIFLSNVYLKLIF